MGDVRVGTRRGVGTEVERGAHWVDLGGTRLTAKDHHILSVDYHADGHSMNTVTIVVACSSFATVDKDESGATFTEPLPSPPDGPKGPTPT